MQVHVYSFILRRYFERIYYLTHFPKPYHTSWKETEQHKCIKYQSYKAVTMTMSLRFWIDTTYLKQDESKVNDTWLSACCKQILPVSFLFLQSEIENCCKMSPSELSLKAYILVISSLGFLTQNPIYIQWQSAGMVIGCCFVCVCMCGYENNSQ